MHKIKNITLIAVSAITLVLSGSTAIVLAQGGSDDNPSSTSSGSSSGSGSGSTTPTQLQQQLQDGQRRNRSAESSQIPGAPNNDANETHTASSESELRHKANDELAEKKKNIKEKSQEDRQKTCEERKKGIETKFSRISSNTEKIQGRIDNVLAKATDYADKNNLNSGDIANLITTANAAKSKSASSVTNLQTLKPTIDCTSNTVPSDIATFKAAAKEARENLKSYRTAVKNLLKALIDASKTSNPTGNSEDSTSSSQGGTR